MAIRRTRAVKLIVFSLMAAAGAQAQSASTVQAFYDDLGRLIKVIDASGNVTTYTYDASGDIQQVAQSAVSSGLSVFDFSPQRGPAGGTVTIQGQGFSTSTSADTVKFNGTPGTVVSATSTTLVVTVPAGATSGPISVTVSGVTAQASSFTVVVVLVSIAAGPTSPSVPLGHPQQYTATGSYSDGSMQNVTNSVAWTSSAPGVARINATGLATPVAVGTATITATLGPVASVATLTVTPAALVSIAISPTNPSQRPGLTVQFTATGTYTDSSTQDLSSAVTWNSSNIGVAAFSTLTPEIINTLTAGTTTITATLGSVFATTTLTVPALTSIAVTPANPSVVFISHQQFTAMGTFANGQTEDLTTSATWASTNTAAAAISNTAGSQGLAITATTAGQTTISATFDMVTGSTTLTVPALVSMAVTPATPTFSVGVNVQFTATGTFANAATGNLTTAVTWSSDNTPVASISNTPGSQGSLTTVKTGSATIEAVLGSIDASTLLTVTNSGTGPSTSSPKFAIVASLGSYGGLSSFAIDSSTGLFTPKGYINVAGINATAVDPSGQFIYVFGNSFATAFGGYTIDPITAAFTAIPGPFPPFSTGLDTPNSVAVDPTDKFVFVTGQKGLYVYTIGTGGALTEVSGSPYSTGQCGCYVTADPAGGFVYTANSEGNNISAYAINPTTGVLTAVTGSPFATGSTPLSIAIDPTGKFLYVADEVANQVAGFAISSSTGALAPLEGSPYAAGTFPMWLSADPSGKFLFALDHGTSNSGTVTAFIIDPASGALSTVPSSPFAAGYETYSMAVDPSGNFLYVVNQGRANIPLACCINDLNLYTINPTTGALSGLRSLRARGTPTSVALTAGSAPLSFTPAFAYAANEGDGNISGTSIDPATGALTAVRNSPFSAGTGPISVATNLAGTYSYVANQGAGNISAYTIDQTAGALTPITGSPFMAGTSPASVTVDPTGRFVYATNLSSNNISAYSITASSGALTAISGSPFALPVGFETGPASMAVDPMGLFAYIADSGSNDIANFVISASTGSLGSGNSTVNYLGSTGSKPVSVVVDPTGNFVYVANSGSNNVSAFSIEDPGGLLSQISGSPFGAGTKPSSVAVDRLSRFLFIANNGSNNVSAFTINSTTGALTAVTNSPFAAGNGPSSVAVDLSGSFLYVTNSGDNTVSEFTINQTTGALSPVPAPTAPTGSNPQSIVTTGKIQ